MTTGLLLYQPLLERVARRLSTASTSTDQLLITHWRVLGLCQYLLGIPNDAEQLAVRALDVYVQEGPGRSTDEALRRARAAVMREVPTTTGSVLPEIAPAKRREVLLQLREYEMLGERAMEIALGVLPAIRKRLEQLPTGTLVAGIRYRLELVRALMIDTERQPVERYRAAAAILYLDELHDAVPDSLSYIGLLDDDFALRMVLEDSGKYKESEALHWAERISALWDELPFLQGVRLFHEQGSIATTWLDRINSYVCYRHALDVEQKPLIIVQPTVACSPLHSIISLIGILVLDGLTSSRGLAALLREGQIYEIDGKFYAQYEGMEFGSRTPGWLRLKFREGVVILPTTLANRMVPVPRRQLSSWKASSASVKPGYSEPIQRFFDWDEAIGAATVPGRVLLVTSRQRVMELFGGVTSNGVSLLDDGILRFAGLSPSQDVLSAGLVLVIPSLAVARQLVEEKQIDVHAIVIDGYERLRRGRHELPFLLMRPKPPAVITWSTIGYYPDEPPNWLPQHRQLHVASNELLDMLELDCEPDDASSRASLWEVATASGVKKFLVPSTPKEQEVLASLDDFLGAVRASAELPEFWKYHLLSSARVLRTLVTATPAYWCDIQEFVRGWETAFREQWRELRLRTAEALEPVARTHREIVSALVGISAEMNSKANALLSYLDEENDDNWFVVCDLPEQVKLLGRFARASRVSGIEPILLSKLGVCRPCIVVGWQGTSFGRRLRAHAPRRVTALVNDSEGQRWEQLENQIHDRKGHSLLGAVGHRPLPGAPDPVAYGLWKDESPEDELPRNEEVKTEEAAEHLSGELCVFIWLADQPEGKVLARDSRVLVETGDQVREILAYRINLEDRVILGTGSSRWSPADEFTQAVVEAIEVSNPQLVRDVKEWRRALRRLQENHRWSSDELHSQLALFGVHRDLQTLEGWLRLDQAAPIGPRHIRTELRAMWKLIGSLTDRSADDVANACERLRSLRSTAGRTLLKLWRGLPTGLGIDEAWLEGLVEQIRQDVQVHEVEMITYGRIPAVMLGSWITPRLAATFEVGQEVLPGREEIYSSEDG